MTVRTSGPSGGGTSYLVGAIVHGVPDEGWRFWVHEAKQVLQWVELMIPQLIVRLVHAGRHPLGGLVVAAIDRGVQAFMDGQRTMDDGLI